MIDEGIQLIEQKVQQAIALIGRLREENKNLKKEIVRLRDEVQLLKEEARTIQDERKSLKDKIDSAVSMLDKVDLDDVLESMAEEVVNETGADAADSDDT